jgi:4-hydroxy-4-methyl-2-oxoglutarate aldolase
MLNILKAEQIKTSKIPRPSQEIVDAYYSLSASDLAGLVARALDRMGIHTTIPSSILEAVQPGKLLVGAAITVRNIPIQPTPYRAWQDEIPTLLGEREAFFLAETGDVIVIDGTSVYPASCLGSMALTVASRLGVAGVVVDGAVTGLPGIRKGPIPIWARSGTTVTGHQRVETIEINGPLGLHGVRVNPGDLVVADDSGVTFVPQPLIETVLAEAQSLKQKGAKVQQILAANSDRETLRAELSNFITNLAKK